MYKKYSEGKLEELRKKLEEKDIESIASSPFLYVTGREEEEREVVSKIE